MCRASTPAWSPVEPTTSVYLFSHSGLLLQAVVRAVASPGTVVLPSGEACPNCTVNVTALFFDMEGLLMVICCASACLSLARLGSLDLHLGPHTPCTRRSPPSQSMHSHPQPVAPPQHPHPHVPHAMPLCLDPTNLVQRPSNVLFAPTPGLRWWHRHPWPTSPQRGLPPHLGRVVSQHSLHHRARVLEGACGVRCGVRLFVGLVRIVVCGCLRAL